MRRTKTAHQSAEGGPDWRELADVSSVGVRLARALHASPRGFGATANLASGGLGAAIAYLLKHWKLLTLFLRRPGAPLDNPDVRRDEQALKRAILHRKNALFYKTLNGAHVEDVFMSLIYTCQLCEANPLDYLTELQRHAAQLSSKPQQWMPWNYRATLQDSAARSATAR